MKKLLFLFIVVLINHASTAQLSLTGKVIAADSKLPVPFASIFLSNTSVGSTSKSDGKFVISGFPSGRYDLVVSCIGFETTVITLHSGNLPAELIVSLIPKSNELQELVIESHDPEGWSKWGKLFMNNFIGGSSFASNCVIKNPEAVKFRFNKTKKILKVFTTETLIIENKSLGYVLNYQLKEFELNMTTEVFIYRGYPFFEEMVAKNILQQKRWDERRMDAYNGSIMHFMRSVFNDNLLDEGFEVRQIEILINTEKERVKNLYKERDLLQQHEKLKPLKWDSSEYYRKVLDQPDEFEKLHKNLFPRNEFAYQIDSSTAGLLFDDYLQIKYTRKKEPIEYAQSQFKRYSENELTSKFILLNDEGIYTLRNGSFFEGTNLMLYGYFSWWEKIATLLPLDYIPLTVKTKK